MANLPTHSWWPGCGAVRSLADFDGCSQPCFSATLISRMEEFNAKHPGKLVTYQSRQNEFLKTVKLTGWWQLQLLPHAAHGLHAPLPRLQRAAEQPQGPL